MFWGDFILESYFFSSLNEKFGFLIEKISQFTLFLKNPNFFVKKSEISSIFFTLEAHQGSFICPFCQLNFS